jgi:phosphoenolpyruvate-protein kinase (PTS system EI component)
LHPKCVGIVSEKGGATSHGVVVARQRNIPIVVDCPEAAAINSGDTLIINGGTAIIEVNGGGDISNLGEVQEAEEPIYGFI